MIKDSIQAHRVAKSVKLLTMTTYEFAILQEAAESPDGITIDNSPPLSQRRRLAEDGFLELIGKYDGFLGGTFRITKKGRAYVTANSVPAEW